MKSGFRKIILVVQLALLLVSLAFISGCWIPLPEETAIVVEVFDGMSFIELKIKNALKISKSVFACVCL